MEETFVKVLNAEEVHNGYKYRPGCNPLDRAFDEDSDGDSCTPNGLYFTQARHVHLHAMHGDHLRKVTLPLDAKFKHGTTKSRANVISLSEESWPLFSLATCELFAINPVHLWCQLSDADPLRSQFWMDIWNSQSKCDPEDMELLLEMIPWAIQNQSMEIIEVILRPDVLSKTFANECVQETSAASASVANMRTFQKTLEVVVIEHNWSPSGEFEMNVLDRLSQFMNSIGSAAEMKHRSSRIRVFDHLLNGPIRSAEQFHAIVKCIPGDSVERNLWEHYVQQERLTSTNVCHLITRIGPAQLYEWMLQVVRTKTPQEKYDVGCKAFDCPIENKRPEYDTLEAVEAQIDQWISAGRGNKKEQVKTIKKLLKVIEDIPGGLNKSKVSHQLFKFIVATGAAKVMGPKFALVLRRKYLELLDNPKCDSWSGDFGMLLDVSPPELYSQIVARTLEDALMTVRSFCEQHQIPCTANHIECVMQSEPRSMDLRAQRDYTAPAKVAHMGWRIIDPVNTNGVRQLCLVGRAEHTEDRWQITIASGQDIASVTTDELAQWPLLSESLTFIGEDYREVLM